MTTALAHNISTAAVDFRRPAESKNFWHHFTGLEASSAKHESIAPMNDGTHGQNLMQKFFS